MTGRRTRCESVQLKSFRLFACDNLIASPILRKMVEKVYVTYNQVGFDPLSAREDEHTMPLEVIRD